MRFQAPRGTEDVLPIESPKWLHLEATFRGLARLYGYAEIRTPTFEDTDLFVRSSGETSDIVTKQMYSFLDKGERSITLKPEGTAPAMRALIEHSLCPPGHVVRLSYVTPIFRYERPQKGRLREAHQFGLELVGSASPAADAEIIELTVRFYQSLGLPDVSASLNSLGREACRAKFREAILEHAASYLSDQTADVRDRLERNPLRLLDSKDPGAQGVIQSIPPVTQFLEEESKVRFDRLQELLTAAGVPYHLAPEIVRGLDYYTETVFEVQSGLLGAQSALCGGGRYDDLIKELGGPPTPSVGVGMGIERVLIALEATQTSWPKTEPDVFIVSIGDAAFDECLALARELRQAGLSVAMDFEGRSMKAQLRLADKLGAKWGLLVGEDELSSQAVVVRNMKTSDQMTFGRVAIADSLKGLA